MIRERCTEEEYSTELAKERCEILKEELEEHGEEKVDILTGKKDFYIPMNLVTKVVDVNFRERKGSLDHGPQSISRDDARGRLSEKDILLPESEETFSEVKSQGVHRLCFPRGHTKSYMGLPKFSCLVATSSSLEIERTRV